MALALPPWRPGVSLEELAVALDHAGRGKPHRALQAGTVYTPVGLLRRALLVEADGERYLVVLTASPEATQAAEVILPRALTAAGLEVRLAVWGPAAGSKTEPRASAVLDTQSPGLLLSPPFLPGEYALWWNPGGEVFPYTRAREVWEAWVGLVAGREKEAVLELVKLLGAPDLDLEGPVPQEVLLPLATENGTPVLLNYREGRPPRLHFRQESDPQEALAAVANLTRLLRRQLLHRPALPEARARTLAWWRGVVREGEEKLLETVGRVRIDRQERGKACG